MAYLAAAVTGTAVGLVCARPVITRIGWSFTIAAVVVVITAVQPWLPPVGAPARALSDPSTSPVLLPNVALALLLAAAAISWTVSRHRCTRCTEREPGTRCVAKHWPVRRGITARSG